MNIKNSIRKWTRDPHPKMRLITAHGINFRREALIGIAVGVAMGVAFAIFNQYIFNMTVGT